MKRWRRRQEYIVTQFSAAESAVLRGLVQQIRDILAERVAQTPQDELATLTGIRTGPSTTPEDRVLARLLPDFERVDLGADPDSAGALRSLHEPDLVEAKDTAARTVLETLPEHGGTVRLTDHQAEVWLRAINDVRLALGTTLDIDDDTPDVLPPDDPRSTHLPVYHWLTYVQESLIQAAWE